MDKGRTCHICGKKYSYCPSCPKDKDKESWHTLFCSEQCMKVDGILSKHTYEKISTHKAAKQLLAVEADKLAIADADIKAAIDGIIEESSKKATATDKVATDTSEDKVS